MLRSALILAAFSLLGVPAEACTIFVLTDAQRALFCNNEDWVNPKTRIWFIPARQGHYGCAIVGFDDGAVQGGLNTEGLAFDGVAGYQEKWDSDLSVPTVWESPGYRLLETCATVDEAAAFFGSHREIAFAHCKFLVADRTGASIILGAHDGKLQVERSNRCRGLGYGAAVLDKMLPKTSEPTIANAFAILRACLQKGATKYSNVFDLKSGDIFLAPAPDRDDHVQLNLAVELKRGGHYYDMPQIRQQLAAPPRPLLANMQRRFMEQVKPIADDHPEIAARIRGMLQDLAAGQPKAADYAPEAWTLLHLQPGFAQAIFKSYGDLASMTLVERGGEGGKHSYYYRMEFQKAAVLQRFDFNPQNKLTGIANEDGQAKPAAGAQRK